MKRPTSRPSFFSWLKNNTYRPSSGVAKSVAAAPEPEESEFLNRVFSTSHLAANLRLILFFTILIIFWGLLVITQVTCPQCDVIIAGLRAPNLTLDNSLILVLSLALETFKLFISPRVISHVLALIIPFWLAIRIASVYLDDIFELHNTRLAGKYLTRSAFAFPNFETIQIREGKLSPTDKNSTAVKIGGPAFAKVHLENAAVFEHPNGLPEVVGPTADRPGELFFMRGFTRLRRAVDLRHQTIPLNQVSGRTRDGIPIQLQNIRLLFSIQRGLVSPNLKNPYPFSREAILSLVYQQPGSGSESSVLSRVIIGLVSGELVTFISRFTLAELLSTIGLPEIHRQIELDTMVRREMERRRQRHHRLHKPRVLSLIRRKPKARPRPTHSFIPLSLLTWRKSVVPPSKYVPRTRLSALFYAEFAEEFPQRARQRGVRLEWIDVGTWNPPLDLVSSRHQEALRLTNENIARGHPRVLKEIRNQSRLNEIVRLNRRHPLASFRDYYENQYTEQQIIHGVIQEYRSLLQVVAEEHLKIGDNPPTRLLAALDILNQYLNTASKPRYHYPSEG